MAKVDYEMEPYTYQLADMDMQDIYVTNMMLIKDAVYTMIGKPKMFDVNNPYQPPYEVDITNLPGWQ